MTNKTLQRYTLVFLVILGSFSSWSLFGQTSAGGASIESLHKLAFLVVAVFLFLIRSRGFGFHKFVLPFLPFVGCTMISFVWRGHSPADLKSSLTLMVPLVLGAALVDADNPHTCIRQWRRYLMLAVILSLAGGLFSTSFGLRSGLRNPWGGSNYQLQGLLGPSEIAIFTCGIILLYFSELENLRAKDWLVILFFLLINLAAGCRTSIIALLLSSLVFYPVAVKSIRRVHLIVLVVVLLFFVGLGISRTWERTFRAENDSALPVNTSKRCELWPRYFDLGKSHLVLGCGPGEVQRIMAEEDIYAPHNEYLSLFVTGGLAGIVTYLFGWGYILRTVYKRNKRSIDKPVMRAAFACSICLAVFAITDNCFRHVFTMCFYAGVLAAAVSECRQRSRVLRCSQGSLLEGTPNDCRPVFLQHSPRVGDETSIVNTCRNNIHRNHSIGTANENYR